MNASTVGRLGAVLFSALFLGAGQADAPDAGEAGEAASCVAWRGEARYRGYGYDHVVVLNNHCDGRALCEVSSDSTPAPTTVVVPAGEELEVLVRRGSPARELTPVVVCQVELRPE